MKRLRLSEVPRDGAGNLYRQGRLVTALLTVLLTVIFAGLPLLFRYANAPALVWGPYGALGVFIVALVVQNLVATLRPTNWLVWVRPDGVLLNCRSYHDPSQADPACVVQIGYGELVAAGQHVTRYTTPSSEGGSTYHRLESLDLELRHNDTQALAAALEECHASYTRRWFLLFTVTTRPVHFPIRLVEANRIRVAWRGGVGNWVSPPLAEVLSELSGHVPEAPAQERVFTDWAQASEPELDEQLLHLVATGDRIDAMKILVKRRGCTLTEAKQCVEQLAM